MYLFYIKFNVLVIIHIYGRSTYIWRPGCTNRDYQRTAYIAEVSKYICFYKCKFIFVFRLRNDYLGCKKRNSFYKDTIF